MSNSVVIGKLRAIHPDHIILGGGLYIMLPAHLSIDGVHVGTSLTVVVHQEDEHLIAESIRKTFTSAAPLPMIRRSSAAELPLPRPDREHLAIGPILRVVEPVHDARGLLADLLGADHEETVAVAVPIAG